MAHQATRRSVGLVSHAVSRVQRKNTFPEAIAECVSTIHRCVAREPPAASTPGFNADATDLGSIDALVVGNMLAPQLQRQQQFASYLADKAGLTHAAPFTVDAACGSGGAAVQLGFNLVQAGFKNVLCVGFEYMTHDDKALITSALAGASHWETEGDKGATFVSLNGQVMTAYSEKYGVDPDELRHISINGHTNANTCEHALFHGKGGLTDDKFRCCFTTGVMCGTCGLPRFFFETGGCGT